jgi:Protein of unknown function (DUF2852)
VEINDHLSKVNHNWRSFMYTASSASADTLHPGTDGTYRHGCGKSEKKRWSAAEIGTMVGGFIVFWPLGLGALGLKLFRGEMWTGASDGVPPWSAYKSWKDKNPDSFKGFTSPNWKQGSTSQGSGNAAFDAYKKEQLERLEAERRKLDEEQKAFGEYLEKLRCAKDQDEFDRFMGERNAPKPAES